MRVDEVRAMTDDRLREEIAGAEKGMFNLRFQNATKQLADSSALGKTRKNIARMKTVQRERELAQPGR
ncbi:MAG: 50S ribosomal protein L29 [Dehalococcoidia bacterium]|nr:50S ribosomal protein L29 [Dehalococcoidia bacterium]